MGEPVTIKGAFFGNERGESYLTIAGAQPTTLSYLTWQDNEIHVCMPEFGDAGLVYVYVNGKKSNGVLFANQATLPKRPRDDPAGAGPRIISLDPPSGSPGTLVSISGSGFGNSRGNGGVFFTWDTPQSFAAPADARMREFIGVSETEFGYELWTDREIRVRVPDGAASGNMEVRTARGRSDPVVFDISGNAGTKIFHDKRGFTFEYSVDVKVNKAQPPNTLYLWIPRPAVGAAQRNIQLLSAGMDPFIEEYRGISLYKIDDLAANSDVRITLSWKIDSYAVQTTVRPQSIGIGSDSPLIEFYSQSSPQLPADDRRIKNQAAAILGRERNPYIQALRIFEWITGGYFTWEAPSDGDIFTALENRRIDSYQGALLYCTLLRSAGIACRPVAGVLVNRTRQTMNHYWAEFWLDGFGWIPVDPAMGAAVQSGAASVPAAFKFDAEGDNFYFGNIDSQWIAFSRGFINLSPMDPQGRTVAYARSWSLQNIGEEVIGGIESYSSLRGDVIITGIYAQ